MIYLDVLLLVNFLTAYFLLLAAGLLSGQRAGGGRMLLGSAVAALSSLILFAPEQPFLIQLAYKAGTALLIVAAAFGCRNKRRFATAVCWYAAFNIALAGLVMLVILNTGTRALQTGNLTVYLRVSPLLMVVLSGAGCLAAELGMRLLAGGKALHQSVGLEVELAGVPVHLRAALDTGCHLKDPITCLPVLLVSYPDAETRLPQPLREFLDAWFGGDPPAEPPDGLPLRLIPCTTAEQASLLPGFAVGRIRLISPRGVMPLDRTAVAFSRQSFGSEKCEALYGSDFL